jgi:hypothetical protein
MKLRQFFGVGGRTLLVEAAFAGAPDDAAGSGIGASRGPPGLLLSLMVPSFQVPRKQWLETKTGERPEGALPLHFLLTFQEYQVRGILCPKKIFAQVTVSSWFIDALAAAPS